MEAVLTALREAIEAGEYAVGDRLPSEAALVRDYGVSRPVVREALRGLQALGLTESHSGRGTFVISSSAADNPVFGPYSARDLLEVRRHVEVPAAGYAAERHSEDDLDGLRDLLERMEGADDDAVWVALDSLFHIAIAQASTNPVFGKVIEEIREALAAQSALLNKLDDTRRHASDAEHRLIVEAIASGSSETAQAAMSAHLDRVDHTLDDIVHGDGTGQTQRSGRRSPR